MRQIYIDLTTENARASGGGFVGYLGEHNATELLITIPQVMVDESDYQVVVFQSGPMVFKTKNITDDASASTFRVGNTIHTKLTRSLTKVSPLGLQVEAYKENENGEKVMVGKTQNVGHLVLKPSPDGFPGFGYDGSFEDIEAAIHDAHKHSNLDVLNMFSVSENGDVMFDGEPLEGVCKYDFPSLLPENAPIGTLAIALNDDVPNDVNEPITINKEYKYLKLKDNIELDDFSIIRYIENQSSESSTEVQFALKDGVNYIGSVIFFHRPSEDMSFMAFIDMGTIKSARVAASEKCLFMSQSGNGAIYFFNPYKEFDLGSLTDLTHPAILPKGWHFVLSQRCDPVIDGYMNINSGERAEISDDRYWFDNYHMPYENVSIVPNGYNYSKQYSEELLSAVFESTDGKPKKRGLYIFTEKGWESINDAVNTKSLIVNTVPDLPLDAEVGTLAYAANDNYIFAESHFNLYKNNEYGEFYLPPSYDDFALLYDFNVVIEQWRHLQSGDAKYGDGINISTNKDAKYFVLEAHATNYPYNRHLIYSWEDQTITYSGNVSFDVKTGWNDLTPYYSPDTVKQLSYEELPEFICENTTSTVMPYYKVISMYAPDFGGERNYLPMYHFGNSPYSVADKGKGLWRRTEGEWHKITETDKYILEED